MALLKQSTTYTKLILLVGSSDHVTGLAAATLTITASKAGAAFATITPTVTDRGSGWYSLALTTAHTDTLGDLALHITATSADPTDVVDQVIAADFGVANLTANVIQVDGVANATHAAGYLPADLRQISGSAVSATTAQLGINVVNWSGSAVATPNTAGVPIVDSRVDAVRVNTAQAIAATTITLDASASATDNYYEDCYAVIVSATTGAGQIRKIDSYVGSTKVATVSHAWALTPTGTVVFAIQAMGRVDVQEVLDTLQTARDLGAQLDATISSRMATFTLPTNFSSLAITGGGAVTAGTVSDKTGYSLTQTFPTNFGSLSVDASGRVDVIKVAGTSQTARDLGANLDTTVSSRLPTANITLNSGAVTVGTNNDKTAYSLAAGGSDLSDRALVRKNTLQAGTGSSATLDTGANANDDFYTNLLIVILTGTGIGQVRRVDSYVGSTKVATLGKAWTVNPGAADYALLAMSRVDVGAVAGTAQTARDLGGQLDAAISSVAPAVFSTVVENSRTFVQIIRGIAASAMNKCSGLAGTTATFRDDADTKDRLTVTCDADGNRSAITKDLT